MNSKLVRRKIHCIDIDILRLSLILLIPHLVVYMILFPGFLQADHQSLIAHIAIGEPTQWHSLLWGYLFFPLLYCTPSFGVYGIAQTLIFTGCALYSIVSLRHLGAIRRKGSYGLAFLFGFAPTYLLYNELYASDVIFAYMLMPLTICLFKIVLSKGEILKNKGFDFFLALLLFIVYELRKNAILIPIFLFFALFFIYRSRRKKVIVLFCVIAACIAGANFFWTNIINAEPSPSQEMLSVPAIQIGYVFAQGGEIPDDAYDYLTEIRDEEDWKSNYEFYSADKEKDSIELNADFIKAWVEIGLRNPLAYARAYIDLMHPYWQLVSTNDGLNIGIDFLDHGFFADSVCGSQCNENFVSQFTQPWNAARQWVEGVQGQILLNHWPGLSDLLVLVFFNRAVPLWIFMIGVFLSIRKRFFISYVVISLPLWCVLISLLLFSPVASFRYAFQTFCILPLLIAMIRFLYMQNALSSDFPKAIRTKERQDVIFPPSRQWHIGENHNRKNGARIPTHPRRIHIPCFGLKRRMSKT